MNKRRAMTALIYLLIPAAVIAADQGMKRRAEKKYLGKPERTVPGTRGAVILTDIHNSGAALNLGEKYPGFIKGVSVALTAAMTLVFFATLGHAGSHMLKAGLSLLLGGAYSNALDRVRQGHVVDYIRLDIGIPALKRVVFNIADFAIIAGAGIAAIKSL
ncbi:MAG: signal peptidase II [Lachnospiraceae bacterium]|nr:signal peptidase II [Lachnospiraceae bacterium]